MKKLLFLMLTGLVLTGCQGQKLRADTEINGATYAADSTVVYYKSGALQSGVLASDTTINGIKVNAGEISFYESGQIQTCFLGKNPSAIDGIYYQGKESSVVNVVQDNSQFKQEWIDVVFPITFYENGKVSEGYLQRDTEIDGFTLKGAEQDPNTKILKNLIAFDDNGNLTQGTVAESVTVGSYELVAGTTIYIKSDGTITGAVLAEDIYADGVRYAPNSTVSFSDSGVIIPAE